MSMELIRVKGKLSSDLVSARHSCGSGPLPEHQLWHTAVDIKLSVVCDHVSCPLITVKTDFWQLAMWDLWNIFQKSLLMMWHMHTFYWKCGIFMCTHAHTQTQHAPHYFYSFWVNITVRLEDFIISNISLIFLQGIY